MSYWLNFECMFVIFNRITIKQGQKRSLDTPAKRNDREKTERRRERERKVEGEI